MVTELIKIKGDWTEVVNDCRATVGKEEIGKEPSAGFKKRILIAEHSPIRDIIFKWHWPSIMSWVATHWVRHKWECFVKTQRTDRTGVNRNDFPQSAIVTFTGEANIQALIDTMRKRLCFQAAFETRTCAEDLKKEIHKREPEIANVLVPNCIYRGGCPEMECCGYFHRMLEQDPAIGSHDIQTRYDAYNRFFACKMSDMEVRIAK